MVGDRVKAGQVLASSGSVGFSPEPHLHLEVHSLEDMRGPSLRFELSDAAGNRYTPVAGGVYPPA